MPQAIKEGRSVAGKSKIVKGALGALTDVFTKGEKVPFDKSRRTFLKGAAVAAPVVGAGAIVGAKATLSSKDLNNIIRKITSAFDEDWQKLSEGYGGQVEKLQKNLGYGDEDLYKIFKSKDSSKFYDDWQYWHQSDPPIDFNETNPAQFVKTFRHGINEMMGDVHALRENPSTVIDGLKTSIFKNEVLKKAPDFDSSELDDLANSLFNVTSEAPF
jgi:hypothetical protein